MSRRPYGARFWASVKIGPGCWEWTASKQPFGYGTKWFCGAVQLAHRISWVLVRGLIPDGLWVLHRCDNARCVRPSHLFLGTVEDNNADRDAKGRGHSGHWDATHCKRGHAFTPENTCRYGKTGRRSCRTCRNLASAAFYERQKETNHAAA